MKRALQPRALPDINSVFKRHSTRSRPALIVLMALLVLANSACQKKHAAVPVPSQPNAVPAEQAPQKAATPPSTTAPPTSNPAPAAASPPKDETTYQKNKPADQPPPPKRAARPANPTPPASAPQTTAPTTTTPPVADTPRLGDILTPEQQKQYNVAIDESLAHAQNSLGAIASRQLTKEQEATAAQVRNFVQQAQTTRKEDLAAAKSLAERAEVLAHDLAESLK